MVKPEGYGLHFHPGVLLDDKMQEVRHQAVIALGKIGEPAKSAVPRLIIMILTDPSIRQSAIETLGQVGEGAETRFQKSK